MAAFLFSKNDWRNTGVTPIERSDRESDVLGRVLEDRKAFDSFAEHADTGRAFRGDGEMEDIALRVAVLHMSNGLVALFGEHLAKPAIRLLVGLVHGFDRVGDGCSVIRVAVRKHRFDGLLRIADKPFVLGGLSMSGRR